MKTLFLVGLLLFVSCGKGNSSGKSQYKIKVRVYDYRYLTCRAIGHDGCGYVADCGRYGIFYCVRKVRYL